MNDDDPGLEAMAEYKRRWEACEAEIERLKARLESFVLAGAATLTALDGHAEAFETILANNGEGWPAAHLAVKVRKRLDEAEQERPAVLAFLRMPAMVFAFERDDIRQDVIARIERGDHRLSSFGLKPKA